MTPSVLVGLARGSVRGRQRPPHSYSETHSVTHIPGNRGASPPGPHLHMPPVEAGSPTLRTREFIDVNGLQKLRHSAHVGCVPVVSLSVLFARERGVYFLALRSDGSFYTHVSCAVRQLRRVLTSQKTTVRKINAGQNSVIKLYLLFVSTTSSFVKTSFLCQYPRTC